MQHCKYVNGVWVNAPSTQNLIRAHNVAELTKNEKESAFLDGLVSRFANSIQLGAPRSEPQTECFVGYLPGDSVDEYDAWKMARSVLEIMRETTDLDPELLSAKEGHSRNCSCKPDSGKHCAVYVVYQFPWAARK